MNFQIGDTVTNFGETATVVGRHEAAGLLILESPGIGRWLADPAKCAPVAAAWHHKDGLVVFN